MDWRWVIDDGSVRVGVTTSRRDLTTSTVVVAGDRALLIDPAWDPDELSGIADELAGTGVDVVAGFATHAHHDHVLWHPRLGPAPRFSSARVAEICADDRDAIVERLGEHWPADLADLVGRVSAADDDTLDWPGPEVRLLTHDAHAPGHTALWLPDRRVLVAGDMLSDVELPLLESSSPADYLAGLELLSPYAEHAAVLIPGHGRVAVGSGAARQRCRADRGYLHTLITGGDRVDPRMTNAGMAAAHAQNLAAAG